MYTSCLIYTVTYTLAFEGRQVRADMPSQLPSFFGCFEDSLLFLINLSQLKNTMMSQRLYLEYFFHYYIKRGRVPSKLPSQLPVRASYISSEKRIFFAWTYLVVVFKFQIRMNYSITFKFFNNVDEKNSKTVTGQELLSFQNSIGAPIPAFDLHAPHDRIEGNTSHSSC